MASVADLPFRLITRRFGCELAYVEMLNARSLCYHSRKTQELLKIDPSDRPLGAQILGFEEDYIKDALKILEEYNFDTIDFNAACPKPKVTRRGEGASLLKDPKKLKVLLKIVVNNSKIPVTCKIRTGWDHLSANTVDIALQAEDAGINGLFIHGRTRMQDYSGEIDYNSIREVKKRLKIPVIASGNIFSGPLAKRMFNETGCDGILIARGALGNPWIFNEIDYFLKKGTFLPKPGIDEIIETMKEHLNLCVGFYGEKKGVILFRKFFGWYTKGIVNARPFRDLAYSSTKKEELVKIIQKLL